ncbi:MAG: ABC transporter permease [Lacunisphaera sp.]
MIVISHGCWRDLFDRAPDVIGRTVRLNNQTVTIIGVAPAGFRGLNGFLMPFFWAPSTLDRSLKAYAIYKLVGRVKPTATEVQALAQFDAITTELAAKYGRRGIPGYERYGTIPSGLRASFEPAGFGSLGDLRSGPFKIPFGRFSVFFAWPWVWCSWSRVRTPRVCCWCGRWPGGGKLPCA